MQGVFSRNGYLTQALQSGYLLNARQVFTATGGSTYTPTAGTKAVLVECQGGGAGGFNTVNATAGQLIAAGGGASGSYSSTFVVLTPGTQTFTVFVGTGGSTSGGNGAATSFTIAQATSSTIWCSGAGGTPGTTITSGTAEAFGTTGGAGTGTQAGDVILSQSLAGLAHRVSASVGKSGKGAPGLGGRPLAVIAQGNGSPGGRYGAGGSGGVSINAGGTATGGAGGQGVCIIWEFC